MNEIYCKRQFSFRLDENCALEIDKMAFNFEMSKSKVIENIVENAIFNNKKPIEKEEVTELKEQVRYFNENCIVIDKKKLNNVVLAFWLEIQEKSNKNASDTAGVLTRIYLKFKEVYGDVEDKFIKLAVELKDKIK